MSPRRQDDERELQEALRSAAAAVLIVLLVVIVLAAIGTPLLGPQTRQDTTLLLGLFAAIIGALLPLVGVQIALRRSIDDDDEGDDVR